MPNYLLVTFLLFIGVHLNPHLPTDHVSHVTAPSHSASNCKSNSFQWYFTRCIFNNKFYNEYFFWKTKKCFVKYEKRVLALWLLHFIFSYPHCFVFSFPIFVFFVLFCFVFCCAASLLGRCSHHSCRGVIRQDNSVSP